MSATRKNVITGGGNIEAQIMFITLSPGVKEDSQNRMFIGPSGLVFDKLLQHPKLSWHYVMRVSLEESTVLI